MENWEQSAAGSKLSRWREEGRQGEGGGDREGKLIKNSSDLSKVTPTPPEG